MRKRGTLAVGRCPSVCHTRA